MAEELDWDEHPHRLAPQRRRYWAERHGEAHDLASAEVFRLFASLVDSFWERHYFQEWFGYRCVDAPDGYRAGKAGADDHAYAYRATRRDDVWPVDLNWREWDDAAFFTAIEFVYDHISKPTSGYKHDFMNCGYHARSFDARAGQRQFRVEVNELLADYGIGWELSSTGEVEHKAATGLEPLLDTDVTVLGSDIKARVAAAITKYRSRQSTPEQRRDAARDLFDVLENIRKKARALLSGKDEDDLFNIANNFAIRHFDRGQKTQYDQPIFHDWMFHVLLATIDAFARLERERSTGDAEDDGS